MEMSVSGAIEALGCPCYIVGELYDGYVVSDGYAVAADGSGLVFSISAMDGGLSLSTDPNQEVIRATALA